MLFHSAFIHTLKPGDIFLRDGGRYKYVGWVHFITDAHNSHVAVNLSTGEPVNWALNIVIELTGGPSYAATGN